MQYTIEELRTENQQKLREQQKEHAAARAGLVRKEEDHQHWVVLYFKNNTERMAKLKSWYPVVYAKLEKQYPWVCKNPDDYPSSVISMVNHALSHMLTPSAFTELKLAS